MGTKRVVLIGAEETGRRALASLISAKANLIAVFTSPHDLPTYQNVYEPNRHLNQNIISIEDINAPSVINKLRALMPDLIYQVGWSQMLSSEVLKSASEACVGMHCSLLPKHRGRAPIPWAIILGLRRSGMTLFYMIEEADKGDIIGQEAFDIGPHDTATDVYSKSVEAAAKLIETYHPLLERGEAPRIAQDLSRSDYWRRRMPQDGLIDWDRTANHLYDWIRALTHPFPGAFTYWRNQKLTVWQAEPEGEGEYSQGGIILDTDPRNGVLVTTATGTLRLHRVQLEGENEVPAASFAVCRKAGKGEILG